MMSIDPNSVLLKMLIGGNASGTVIGKGGCNMQDIQGQSQAQLRMSQQNEVLDSGERILSISGPLDTVCRAQQLVTGKIAEFQSQQRSELDLTTSMKMLVPNVSVGLIIGKGGGVIKELMTETGCRIQVSQVAQMLQHTQERIVSLEGSEDCIAAAQRIITAKLFEAPPNMQPQFHVYKELANAKPSAINGLPPPSPYGAFQQPGASTYPGFAGPNSPSQQQPSSSLQLRLPNATVGGLIGKGGANIKEIMLQSGARVQVSQKADMQNDGSDDRLVTIAGSMEGVAKAHYLVSMKLQQIQMQAQIPK